MKITINFNDFESAFKKCGRGEQFSYNGLVEVFDWLEDLEDSTGTEQELDVIGLCCEFTEYNSFKEFQKEHGKDYECIEDVENETTVIHIDYFGGDDFNDETSSFIIQNF